MKTAIVLFCIGLSLHTSAQQNFYNNNFSIACHNCYEPQYASNIEEVFVYTTTIEIDIWDNEIYSGFAATIAGSGKMDRDWFVKHEFNHKGNLNCCGGTFRNCLKRIKKWSEQNPTHQIITIFIDKKENWSDADEARQPKDLDQLLTSVFPRDLIFKPSDLLKDKQSLKVATQDNWLTLDSLKGKFIFVITDGTINSTGRNPLNEYLEAQKNSAICFVAPEISSENEIQYPTGISSDNGKNVIFYNLKYPINNLSSKINSIGCLSRIYNSPENIDIFNFLKTEKVNFIAMKNFKFKF